MWQEFKTFLMRGNAIELAVGIVIGAAFTAIVNSIVNDLINPIIGILLGGVDFSGWNVTVGEATFGFGNLILALINFLIVGLVLFLVVKAMNRVMRKEAAKPAEPPAPSTTEKLLMEIRDELKGRPTL
jgi:large conductance mechanosensitive channel